MRHTLEDLLNLPENREILDSIDESETTVSEPANSELELTLDSSVDMYNTLAELDVISAALPTVSGLGTASDRELDDLATRATNAFDDLMAIGMNMESRYSGRIFEVASTMLKNAIDAKSAKLDKKLKMVDLQLKKYRIDSDKKNKSAKEDPIEGEGYLVTDRNSLLEKLRNMQ